MSRRTIVLPDTDAEDFLMLVGLLRCVPPAKFGSCAFEGSAPTSIEIREGTKYVARRQRWSGMLRARIAILGLALVGGGSSVARAEVALPAKLGDGFELVIAKDAFDRPRVHVRKGKLTLPLDRAEHVEGIRIDRAARSVTLDLEDSCLLTQYTQTWTYDRLGALLESSQAELLREKKNDKEAARGFARAAALDPTWNAPAYALAAAQARLGDASAALKALSPWLANEPIGAYVRVSTNPDLAPLLARPELQAIRGKQPGTALLTADGIVGKVAIAGSMFAAVREATDGGSSGFTSDLVIYEVAAGVQHELAATPLVTHDDSNHDCYPEPGAAASCRLTAAGRTAVARRAALLQTMLRELGFVQAAIEPATTLEDNGWHAKRRYAFPKHKLGIVVDGYRARVLQRDTALGEGQVEEVVRASAFLEGPGVVAVWSTHVVSENGCDAARGNVTLIPVKMP